MAKVRTRDERKEQQWRRSIREWRASGMSVRAYCAVHGLAEPSFYAWRRQLQRRRQAATAFVPVRLVGEQDHGDARRGSEEPVRATGAIELVLAGNRTVRVTPGFDAATLRQVLAVLREEDQPC